MTAKNRARPPVAVATYPGFDERDEATAGLLRDAGFAVRFYPKVSERAPGEVAEIMAGATAGIVSTDPFDASVFDACPELRVLARVGVGTDSIDLTAATDAAVAVTVTPFVNAATVADHTLALMLACTRRLLENDRALRNGSWERGGRLIGSELTGATVGIVGLGATGLAVAQRLTGFDVKLLAADIRPVELAGVTLVELDALLRAADVVSVHVPLLLGTRGMIGSRELDLMGDGAILVNTSRGGVVDEWALAGALSHGRLAAAGIDVFVNEPPAASPLLGLPNVVLSPHVGGISVRSQREMLEMAVGSVIAVMQGRRPPGLLNPEALEPIGERQPV
jgi:D-3-phosphoglycerate dehydrogenase / 2-oxoglutarate reductase